MTTILLEVQGSEIRLWINTECLRIWKKKYTGVAGAPLQLARDIEKAFSVAHVPAVIEFGEGFEELSYDE